MIDPMRWLMGRGRLLISSPSCACIKRSFIAHTGSLLQTWHSKDSKVFSMIADVSPCIIFSKFL